MESYESYKRKLQELQLEERNLSVALNSATSAGDVEELVSLKNRQAALPAERYAAEVMLQKSLVEKLRAEESASRAKLAEAKARSIEVENKANDAFRIIDAEKQKIKEEAFSSVAAVFAAENELRNLAARLREAEKNLAEAIAA